MLHIIPQRAAIRQLSARQRPAGVAAHIPCRHVVEYDHPFVANAAKAHAGGIQAPYGFLPSQE